MSGSAAVRLGAHDGAAFFAAPEVILKALFECEVAVGQIAGPRRGPLGSMWRLAQDDGVAMLLRRHDLRIALTETAARAIEVTRQRAASGGSAVAWWPADELGVAADTAATLAASRLPRGTAVTLMIEDDPAATEATSPYDIARRLDLPALVPSDLTQLQEGLDTTLRISRATGRPMSLIVHRSILLTSATLVSRPNRVIESVDAMLARRRRRRGPRLAETEDVLRLVRRLELNKSTAVPSPGERAAIGFVTVGPAAAALLHLSYTLRLVGRLPVLQLTAVHPVDEAATRRLLSRCEQVMVLEPRPGTVESEVAGIAESMRHEGERPGHVWGQRVPPVDDVSPPPLAPDEAIHPSRLARRIVHVLHTIRPGGHVAAQLMPDPPAPAVDVPSREAMTGVAAALAELRDVVVEVDQRLREREVDPEDEQSPPATALAIDGIDPEPAPPRVVTVELYSGPRFRTHAIAAIRHASRESRPWILIAVDLGDLDGLDLERLSRGLVPADRADRVRIEQANLAERGELSDRIEQAALAEGLTVIIVGDGPPPRFSPAALERELADVDRLGFEPRQRRWRPADVACAVRPALDDERRSVTPAELSGRAALRVDRLSPSGSRQLRWRVRPLYEDVSVVRTKPPLRRWRDDDDAARLPLPQIIHRRAGTWRAHLAGGRGAGLGTAGQVLADAGRRMGYEVRAVHDPTPIGAGRRAWTQLLFMRPREGEALPLTARTPYGEADLLLGLDPAETLRAVQADRDLRVAFAARTHAIVNTGLPAGEADTEEGRDLREEVGPALRHTSLGPTRIVADFASVCRAWFHTDRVVDLALLGAAFQRGLVPVTVSAIEDALKEAQAAGSGRALDAFQFGRWLAVHPRLFSRPGEAEAPATLDLLVRRLARVAQPHWGSRRSTRAFARCLRESVASMPGLADSAAGREAARDFVLAMYRCFRWGGCEYAERYAKLVTSLYAADRAESGRALTRHAVLPLAGAMLVRDPLYVASMLTSGEERLAVRHMLSVKRARGDELRRRLVTRFDLSGFGRRVRLDVRTSDGPAVVLAALRPLVPARWRGSRRERALRAFLIDVVERATEHAGRDYEHYQNALHRLHQQALDNRLRGMALAEIQMLASPPDDAEDGQA